MPGKRKYRVRLSMHIIDRHQPDKSDWWIRFKGKDIFPKNVYVYTHLETKIRRSQPIGVMEGYARDVMFNPVTRVAFILG